MPFKTQFINFEKSYINFEGLSPLWSEDIQSAVVDTGGALKADWEKFKADANDKIMQNEDTIQAIKKKVSKEDVKIKGKLDKEVTRLEEKNNELKTKLIDYKDEGKYQFENFSGD